jgi:hypothetical protein
MRNILVGILLLLFGCTNYDGTLVEGKQAKAVRVPFQRTSVVIRSPSSYLKRKTNGGEYDPSPKVVLTDEKAGKYEFRWVGYDGKEKVIKYQRHDALDAVVEARIETDQSGKLAYKYLVKNMPSSPAYLSGFVVQTMAKDVRDEPFQPSGGIYVGHMGNYIPAFQEGVWRRFAPLEEILADVQPGKNIEFTIVSSALPGLVRCRATGGDLISNDVGEHMPAELEASFPGYDIWASGYTIGPIDKLSTMNKIERAKYILENLTKFVEAGWMLPESSQTYRMLLDRGDLKGALKQAEGDIKIEAITQEVFTIIGHLNS